MPCWWVNQNQTYRAEVRGSFMWSVRRRLHHLLEQSRARDRPGGEGRASGCLGSRRRRARWRVLERAKRLLGLPPRECVQTHAPWAGNRRSGPRLTLLKLLSKFTQTDKQSTKPVVRAEPGGHSRGQAGRAASIPAGRCGRSPGGQDHAGGAGAGSPQRPERLRVGRRADPWRCGLACCPVGPGADRGRGRRQGRSGAGPRRGAEDPWLVRDREAALGRGLPRPLSAQGGTARLLS